MIDIEKIEPYNGSLKPEDSALFEAGRPESLRGNTTYATIDTPLPAFVVDPQTGQGSRLFTVYQLMYAVSVKDNEGNSQMKIGFLAPGQAIPVYRRRGGRFEMLLQCLELRAYALPMLDGNVCLMGGMDPDYKSLPHLSQSLEVSEDTVMARPGGEHLLRPHPGLVGLMPYKGYKKDPGVAPLLRRSAMQVTDFVDLFGAHPLIKLKTKKLPFSFVSAKPVAAAGVGGFPLHSNMAASPFEETMLEMEGLHLPISFDYAENIYGESFNVATYEGAVEDHLKDEEFLYIHHDHRPYADGGNPNVVEALESVQDDPYKLYENLDEVPQAGFVMGWNQKADYASLSPGLYDSARRFRTEKYNPKGA